MTEGKSSRIVRAASNCFERSGFRATSMAEIAAEAGVALGTVYACFDGKEALFRAVGRPELREWNPGRDRRRDALRASIRAAALHVFSKKGFGAAVMDDIAAEAGCTKAAIYEFYSGKEELFASLFSESGFFSIFEDEGGRVSESGAGLECILAAAASRFLALFEDEDRRNLLKIVIAESGRFPRLAGLMYENTIERVRDEFSAILDGAAIRGEIDPACDRKLAARAYFGMLYSFILTDRILKPSASSYSDAEVVAFAAATFARGLRASPPAPSLTTREPEA